MLKKIIAIVLLFVICLSCTYFIALQFDELLSNVQSYKKVESGETPVYSSSLVSSEHSEDAKKDILKDILHLIVQNAVTIIFYISIAVVGAFAIYELICSIRHPMRYAVEGAQQSYADYKEWREKVRADREAAAKEARRAELERELAELKKTE